MRFVTYEEIQDLQGSGQEAEGGGVFALRSAWVEDDGRLVDISAAYAWHCEVEGASLDEHRSRRLSRLDEIIRNSQDGDRWRVLSELRGAWQHAYARGDERAHRCVVEEQRVRLRKPMTPHSFRDFYAFEQHVKTCRAKRGLDMVPEWYDFPVFYFSNHHSFRGPEEPVWAPDGCHELDFELEVACVLGQTGSSISVAQADDCIAGYVILNDWSARDIQRAEVKVGLGPAKGKDFATSFGPYFVTPDELSDVAQHTEQGIRHRLTMQADVNGHVISHGSLENLHYTFAEMIARASKDVTLYAGDVLGSGTVGTGCILELGTEIQSWLRPGDLVTLSVERLGSLRTPIVVREVGTIHTERR
jgi:fumarylacetoacetate (FAA) hydrolase